MNTSSETLFHFTHSRSNLERILKEKFHVSYCKETIAFADFSKTYYFPMVTFCDIPLTKSFEHVVKYGGYGIGLSKDWGIRNQLNPVTYIEAHSKLALDFKKWAIASLNWISQLKKKELLINHLLENLSKDLSKPLPPIHTREWIEKVLDYLTVEKEEFTNIDHVDFPKNLLRFTKNYQGDLHRGGKTYPNYKFYDEKEWRFVPDQTDPEVKFHLDKTEYEKYRTKSKTKPLLTNTHLDFTATDIKYLIVKSENDVSKLIKKISEIKGLAKSSNERDLLITKIITIKQLKSDF